MDSLGGVCVLGEEEGKMEFVRWKMEKIKREEERVFGEESLCLSKRRKTRGCFPVKSTKEKSSTQRRPG